MRKYTFLLAVMAVFGATILFATNDFKSVTNGNWTTLATWNNSTDNGATWGVATVAPDATATSVLISNGTAVSVTAAPASTAITLEDGATLTVGANWVAVPLSTITGTTAVIDGGGTYGNLVKGFTIANGNKATLKGSYNTTTSGPAWRFDATGTLSIGSELILNGTGTTENKFGLTSADANYLSNTKISLNGKAFLYIEAAHATSTINIGTLSGESGTYLGWGKSSTLTNNITWSVGANNENSEFAGTITNKGGYKGSSQWYYGNYTNLTKVGTGTLTLSGTSNSYNGNLTINNGEVVVSGTLAGNSRTMTNTVAVAAGKKLTVTGNFTATNLTLNSDETGTATLVNTGTVNLTTATVNQYLPTGRNWYVGIPVTTDSNIPYTALTAAGASSVSYWDETNGAWVNGFSGNLSRGIGYIAVSNSGTATNNISFTGTLNDGNVDVAVSRTVGKTKEGFNLISNPYPSYLNAMTAINASSKMEPTIWYRTKGSSYSFETINTTSGEGTNGVTGYIPPMQGFWVRVKPNSVDPLLNNSETLTFTNAMRTHANPSGVTTTLLKTRAITDAIQRIRLQVSNGSNSDETLLYTNSEATNTFDAYDSRKMSNDDVAIPEIYTIIDTVNLVINGFNQLPVNTEIPLGFKTGEANTFTIKTTQLSNLAEYQVILKDKQLNTETELTESTVYSFSSDIISSTNRFSILLKSASVTTATNKTIDTGVSIYSNEQNQIVVKCLKERIAADVSVYNLAGQKLINKQIKGSTILDTILPAGIYVVRLNSAGNIYSNKLIVK